MGQARRKRLAAKKQDEDGGGRRKRRMSRAERDEAEGKYSFKSGPETEHDRIGNNRKLNYRRRIDSWHNANPYGTESMYNLNRMWYEARESRDNAQNDGEAAQAAYYQGEMQAIAAEIAKRKDAPKRKDDFGRKEPKPPRRGSTLLGAFGLGLGVKKPKPEKAPRQTRAERRRARKQK